jgi:acetyl-CoA C-acetyltransferase
MKKIGIIGGARIPFARTNSNYKQISNKEMMTAAMKALVQKYNLEGKALGLASVGAVAKSSHDFSMARECLIDAGLSYDTPACDIQMACGTSLETTNHVGNQIAMGQIEAGIAGGVDSSSVVPIELKQKLSNRLVQLSRARNITEKFKLLSSFKPSELIPNFPAIKEPRTGLSMGEHCELMVQEWNISREEQDNLAYQSHKNTVAAYESGFYNDLVFSFGGLDKDNNVRPDSSIEKLGKLRAAFDRNKGTLTAGNSSPMTDGASCVLLANEEYALKNNYDIDAFLTHYQSAAVDYKNKEGLLMAPAYAIPKLLAQAGLTLQDFDFYEIHEAFAGQVLCTLKALNDKNFCQQRLGLDKTLGEIDMSKLNVKGGSVAIGHPFAATGTRIVASLAKALKEKGSGRGLVSICAAGGMGVTAIIER